MRVRELTAVMGVLLTIASVPAGDAFSEEPRPLELAIERLEAGEYGNAFREAAVAKGLVLPQEPVVSDPTHALMRLSKGELDRVGAADVLADVPTELRPGIDTMLVGLAKADVLVATANAALVAEHGSLPSVIELLGLPASGGDVPSDDSRPNAEPAADITLLDPEAPPTLGATIDTGPYVLAQALAVEAVQRGTAQLVEAVDGGGLTRPSGGGDIVNRPPHLIVSGITDDEYGPNDNAVLIVDLAGDDKYRNARGSPFGHAPYTQVIVDLAGNDDYNDIVVGHDQSVFLATQGAGVAGVGGILDVAGDDLYGATSVVSFSTTTASGAVVIAQGAGSLGAGFLIDLQGRDCVGAHAGSLGAPATVIAQGAASTGAGLAVLLGDQGNAGCLSRSARATADNVVSSRAGVRTVEQLGTGVVIAQGAASSGVGVLASGPAANAYRALGGSEGHASVLAQGASVDGVGILTDPSGDDTYKADAWVDEVVEMVVSDDFQATAQVEVFLGASRALAQGATMTGLAALHDAGAGQDSFVAGAKLDAYARATATVTAGPDAGTASATALVEVQDATVRAQGAAVSGIATLSSATPNDVSSADDIYIAGSTIFANAEARTVGGAQNHPFASLITGRPQALGQGWSARGAGILTDVGGNDDYVLGARPVASADVHGDGADPSLEHELIGLPLAAGQGSGTGGAGLLIDLFGFDEYSMVPGPSAGEDNACWSHSPPSFDPSVGVGADLISVPGRVFLDPPLTCLPVPPN